jgi:hypothetical protein
MRAGGSATVDPPSGNGTPNETSGVDPDPSLRLRASGRRGLSAALVPRPAAIPTHRRGLSRTESPSARAARYRHPRARGRPAGGTWTRAGICRRFQRRRPESNRSRRLCRAAQSGVPAAVTGVRGSQVLPQGPPKYARMGSLLGSLSGAGGASHRTGAPREPEPQPGAGPCSLRCARTGRYTYLGRSPLRDSLHEPSSLTFAEPPPGEHAGLGRVPRSRVSDNGRYRGSGSVAAMSGRRRPHAGFPTPTMTFPEHT